MKKTDEKNITNTEKEDDLNNFLLVCKNRGPYPSDTYRERIHKQRKRKKAIRLFWDILKILAVI